MKLKFRAESKDVFLFIIFAIVLLFLIALAVLNAYEFLDTGTLWGFNPLPAFTPEFFAPTMVFYLGTLIAVFASVSSYFFDMEKGTGFRIGKTKEEGYSRWMEPKEMKRELSKVNFTSDTSDVAGIPIMNNGKELWVDGGEYHNLVIGSTGAGKTQIIVQPMVRLLAKKGESMLITDPKGEIYEKNAEMLRERGYNVVVLNFRDPQRGSAWNPMTLPYSLYREGNADKANELLDDLAMNILYDENAKSSDPFWEKTSADYFTGLSLAIFEDAKEEEINLNTINLMTTVGEDKFMGTTFIKDYFSYKSKASPAYVNVASTLMAPSDTKSSILSVFKQKIKLFTSRENLSEMLSHSDFDMKDIGRKKTAVFLIIQDEKKTYHSLVTIFIKQCYETLIDVAQESGGKLPFKTNFILDEFANMPPLKDVTTMVTAARSRNIRFTFIIQNFAQLTQVYGKENGDTIKGNCGNTIYLISNELASLEEISKLCGEKKSKEKDKTASTPLVTVSDLQRLEEGTVVVMRIRSFPFKTKMMHDWKMERDGKWGRAYPKAAYVQREKAPVQLFDIQTFCQEKRKEKMEKNGITDPGMGMGMPNPGANPFNNPNYNPFAQKPQNNAMPSNNPFMQSQQPNGKAPGNANFDDLIKRIDAKIAELEDDEKVEKGQIKEPISAEVKPAMDNKKTVETKNITTETNQIQNVAMPVRKDKPANIPMSPIMNDDIKFSNARPKVESSKPVVTKNVINNVESNPIIDNKPVEKSILKPIIESKPVEKPITQPIIENKPVEKPIVQPIIENKPVEKPIVQPVVENKNIEKPIEQPLVEKQINIEKPIQSYEEVEEYDITDDQFFDDFFSDDE
ncbi:MAG: type IV secretory system conjugative DNA transfer family protein [Mycoplasmatota bacterium]